MPQYPRSHRAVEENRIMEAPGTGNSSRLKGDALTVVGAVVMAMAFMGPATSVFFNTPPAVAGAGIALPFGILLALVVSLLVASAIGAFAQKIPTAGFAYTFNTHGFGKRGGFLSGWLLAFSYAMVGPMLFAGMGAFAADFVKTQFGLDVPWWVFTIVIVAVVWLIGATGVRRSAQTALIFLILEVGVMLALFATILGRGGAEGLTLAPLNPANSSGNISGLGIGMLWGILFFIGFESAGTLGEETKHPKRNIPIAVLTAVVVIGVFYVLSGYAGVIGFGPSHIADFQADSTPWFTLATRYWGSQFDWIVALTVLNSIFANLISGCTAEIRVIFAMGREGILPRPLGVTNHDGNPMTALGAYMLFSLVLALVGGWIMGPFGAYAFYGTILGLGMVIIYLLVNLALIAFYRRDYPAEFSVVRHGVLPAFCSLLLLLPIYGLLWPVPAFPNNLVPYIVVVWMLVGIAYLFVVERRSPSTIDAMGRVMGES
jgi:amino acid transporter